MLLDGSLSDSEVRQTIFERISPDELLEATSLIHKKATSRPPHYYDQLLKSYRSIRRFIPTLLKTISFQGTTSSQALLKAWEFLHRLDHKDPRPSMQEAPQDVIHGVWASLVFDGDGRIDRRYYTFCVLQQLQESLRSFSRERPGSRSDLVSAVP